MTDETRPEGQATESTPTSQPENTAVAEPPQTTAAEPATEAEGADDKKGAKLHQTVEIRDVGPCKKHIKVSVERKDIDDRFSDKFSELVTEGNVAGFRPGKAPRRIIERRYHKEVGDQVKTEVLLASLQQLGEDHDIAPLSSPDINPANIELPKEGPLVYEFEVEVRPQFDLPNYRGLRLRRPLHEFTDDEVAQEERRLLAPYGQVVPKPEGSAQTGDIVVADLTVRDGDRVLSEVKEATFPVNRQLAFKDGVAEHFGDQIRGPNAGDTRVVDVAVSSRAADAGLRGKTVQASFHVKDVKTMRLPELTHEFLHTFGVHAPDEFRELVRVVLQRRLEHAQRQSARQQVLEQIAAATSWQLPEDLLMRQARKSLARKAMEMRADGIAEDEIAGRIRLMQQDVLQSTALALKEHFVLQKIAEVEKIDVDEDDIRDEIERLANQSGESPRRVRAQLEKEDMMDALAAEMIERKALDLILESADYEDVPLGQEQQPAVSTVETQAVPGEMHDPTVAPPEATPEATPGGGEAAPPNAS